MPSRLLLMSKQPSGTQCLQAIDHQIALCHTFQMLCNAAQASSHGRRYLYIHLPFHIHPLAIHHVLPIYDCLPMARRAYALPRSHKHTERDALASAIVRLPTTSCYLSPTQQGRYFGYTNSPSARSGTLLTTLLPSSPRTTSPSCPNRCIS